MKFFDFRAFQRIGQIPSHDEIIFHMFFGAFHITPRLFNSRKKNTKGLVNSRTPHLKDPPQDEIVSTKFTKFAKFAKFTKFAKFAKLTKIHKNRKNHKTHKNYKIRKNQLGRICFSKVFQAWHFLVTVMLVTSLCW